MALGEKYFATWDDFGGIEHEIKLLQEGGSGTNQIDILQTTPFTRSFRGGKKVQIESQILGSEIKFNFVVASADIAAFDAILESDYKEWAIEHYYNSVLDFTGWLQPDNFSREYIQNGDYYFFTYSAVDGLANLKNIEFTNFSDGSQFEDRVTIMTTLKRALEHVEFDLDFRVQLGTFCTNDSLMTSTECALDKVTHDSRRFQKTKDGRLTNTNCYQVISDLLEPFNCYMMQSQAKYWIVNTREDNSFFFPIPWTTLTVGARTASDLKIDITGNEDFTNRGNFQKIRPLETVGSTFRDRNVRDSTLTNGDFHLANTNEWVIGADMTSISTKAFEDNFEMDVVKSILLDGVPATVPSFSSIAQAIVVRGDADQIQVEFKVRVQNVTMDGAYVGATFNERVKVKCQIRKGTVSGDIISSGASDILIGNPDSAYTLYKYFFDITGDDDYFIEFLVDKMTSLAWTDYEAFDLRFDDFKIIAAYSTGEDITFDKYHKVSNADSSFTDFLDLDIQFGDSASDSDIGAFKISGTRTETWSRFGKTEDISLNFLVAKNIIENFSKYKDYIRLTIIDDTDRILPHSIIQIDSSNYQIVSQGATFKGGLRKELKVELVEVLNAAVNVTLQSTGLSSVDGSGDSSSPFDDAVTNPSTNPSQPGLAPSLQQVTDVGNLTTNNIGITSTDNSYFTGSGNVGIGTTTPIEKLQVGDNSATDIFLSFQTSNANSRGIRYYLADGSTLRGYVYWDTNEDLNLKGDSIHLDVANKDDALFINNVGDVGIGTTSPGTALEVNGVINATTNLQEGGSNISTIYEGVLGNPASDGFVLASTTGGVRSWVEHLSSSSFLRSDVDTIKTGGNLTMNDGLAIFFGTNDDLVIFHDSLDAFIYNTTGDLHIRALISEDSIIMYPNAAVELYYDDVLKFETVSGGTKTTGNHNVNQNGIAAAIPALIVNQTDVSEEMIEFQTTIGTGNAIEVIGAKTLTVTHFIKVTIPGGLTRYFPVGTIA